MLDLYFLEFLLGMAMVLRTVRKHFTLNFKTESQLSMQMSFEWKLVNMSIKIWQLEDFWIDSSAEFWRIVHFASKEGAAVVPENGTVLYLQNVAVAPGTSTHKPTISIDKHW